MRIMLATGLAAVLLATTAQAQERRELGAHEHGHATLDVAVEGGAVTMMLAAPAADIVGFEHAAKSEADKEALDGGMAALEDPLALFAVPDGAGCALDAAEVRQAFEEHHGEGHADEHAEEGHAGEEHAEAAHSEILADYQLTCADPAAIDAIAFAAYFERFPDAQEVEVNLVTETGQWHHEVTRDAPNVTLDAGA